MSNQFNNTNALNQLQQQQPNIVLQTLKRRNTKVVVPLDERVI